MNSILRFLNGYLIIKIIGDDREKLINRATINGIILKNFRSEKDYITVLINLKDFKKLRKIKRKTDAKIKIFKKRGIPFIIGKYKKRTGFLTGIILFFIILETMSGFIWKIDVHGNKNIDDKTIINSCKKIGISEGKRYKKSILDKKSQELLLDLDNLSWAAINEEGCILSVDVSEIKDKNNKEKPGNIKSSADGIITKIDITSGMPLVKVGDAVSKDELLVSGIIEGKNTTQFVKSKGDIFADTQRSVESTEDYRIVIKEKTKKREKRAVLSLFGLKIPLFIGDCTEENVNSTTHKQFKLLKKEIPIALTVKEYTICDTKKEIRSKNKLEKILIEKNKKYIEKNFGKNAKITDFKTEFSKSGAKVTTYFTTNENIAVPESIIVEDQN